MSCHDQMLARTCRNCCSSPPRHCPCILSRVVHRRESKDKRGMQLAGIERKTSKKNCRCARLGEKGKKTYQSVRDDSTGYPSQHIASPRILVTQRKCTCVVLVRTRNWQKKLPLPPSHCARGRRRGGTYQLFPGWKDKAPVAICGFASVPFST